MRERSCKRKWNLQCRVNRDIPQGVHPQRRLRTRPRQIETTTSKGKPIAHPAKKKGRIKNACTIEADESVRKRTQETQHKDHEDHIAVRRLNFLSHYNLVHKPVPILCAMMIPDGNAAVDVEWDRKTCQHGERRKPKATKRSSSRRKKKAEQFILRPSWTYAT